MKKKLVLIFILLFIPLVFAYMNSTNYNISSPVVTSGGNASSTDYKTSMVLDNIIGSVSSSSYNQAIGFFFAEGKSNKAPNTPSPNLESIGGTNKTTEDLNCSVIITDNDDSSLNVSVRWYNDNGLNLTVDYNNTYSNATLFNATLNSGNTSKTQNWTCSIRLYDGEDYSSWGNSSTLTILNTLPTVTLSSPEDENTTTNRTPFFSWSGSDDDGDSLEYELNLTLVASGLCTDPDRGVIGISDENYTVTHYLNCLYDNSDYYEWSVRASDDSGATYGAWSSIRKIYINSDIVISLPVDAINFGSFVTGTNDTSDNAPLPFELQNDGNCLINASINATDLWTAVSNPTDYFKYKIDNKSGEEGAFNWLQTQTSWTQIPTAEATSIVELNWSSSMDIAEIDLNVTVPSQEAAGDKSSTVYFIASLGE